MRKEKKHETRNGKSDGEQSPDNREDEEMNKRKTMKEKILKALEMHDISELFDYGYQNGIDMYEIWSGDNTELIGFQVEDEPFYFAE